MPPLLLDPRFRIALLLCAAAAALVSVTLLGSGCASAPATPPRVIVAPESEAARQRDGALAAHLSQAQQDNAKGAPSLPQQAVELHLSAARAALPLPSEQGAAAAADLSAALYSGDPEKARAAGRAAQTRMLALAREHEREREARSIELSRTISQFQAALTEAQAQAERQARLRITSIFALLGAGVALLGIGCALTGWSRIGLSLIPAGVALGGSGLLWGRPWFLYTVGGSLALCCVAVGIAWAVQVSRNRKQAL